MVIAGSDRTTRRRSARRQEGPPPATYGPELRQARQQLDLSLGVIQDRTGIHSRDLEALEDGDLSRFRDQRAALVAVRRFADTVGLDAEVMTQAVAEQWRYVAESPALALTGMTGVTATTRGDVRLSASAPIVSAPVVPTPVVAAPVVSGPVASPPGGRPQPPLAESSHLRAFTQTAQVPRVNSAPATRAALPPGLRFDSTDAIPVTPRPVDRRRPPASVGLRVAVWTLVLLLLVGVAGLSIDHWRPGWLAKLHLVASGPATNGQRGPGAGSAGKAPIVTSSTTAPGATAVTVHSPGFQVVVATQVPCWIGVSGPDSATPIFSATVPAGTTKVFTSVKGQLSVDLGARGALVAVEILGKTVPGWLFAPSSAPYVLTFRSASP